MSNNLPLSVKYRPKKLSEVIGQPVVVTAFTNAFECKTLHHAYILSGNYGTGKTTVARILAAMDNCEEGPTLEPCGKCSICKDIFSGKSFDVKEMNAADARGIDNIRTIQKEAYVYPIDCRVKYFILDEAHSMTKEASECALKVIEEPPEFVRFILCSTEAHRFTDTIKSRCITWNLNKVSWTEIYNHLLNIVEKEKLNQKLDKAILRVAAKYARGSVRDALQNVQTVINYCGDGEITFEKAIEALGKVNSILYFNLFDAIIGNNISDCVLIINKIFQDGKEASSIIRDIEEHLNNLLLIKHCKEDLSVFSLTDNEIKTYNHQAEKLKSEAILAMMGAIIEVGENLKTNIDPQHLCNKFVIESILKINKLKK